ncbi:metallophosphoesterase family protein [Caproiciproducens sp. LBM24188]|nr:metallophosphoesterase [Oscillospiraceae bacterium]HHV30813.1 metallophosphoesterase [Clostridiales bacterium]
MIYITGDLHGEMSRFDSSAMKKLKKGDTLIVCGDFGFIWDGGEKEEKALKKLNRKKYRILFVDGTHENFDLLERYPVTEWNGGKVQCINENVYHLMRGQIFTLEGKTIFTFGGGESPEKLMRMEVGKWWEQEMPSVEEMKEGVLNLRNADMKVDYIVTHEPPPKITYSAGGQRENANQLDAYFEQLAKQVEFRRWFFGSVHFDRKITSKNIAVFNDVIPMEAPQQRRFR